MKKICPLHPNYKGFKKPKSKKRDCICLEIYKVKRNEN